MQKSIDLLEQARIALKKEGDIWWYTLSLSGLGTHNLFIGKTQESKVLFQEAIQLVDPGDLRLSLPIRNGLAIVAYREDNYTEAERLLQENLKLSLQLGYKLEIANIYLNLARVVQSTGRLDQAKSYYQECVDRFGELGESSNLVTGLIHLGKFLASCQETEAARKNILKAIQIARSLNIFHLIYWGLVILARIYWVEGQPEKALEIALILRRYTVEAQIEQDDFDRLRMDLYANLPPEQISAVMNRAEGMMIEALLDQILDCLEGPT